MNSAVSIIMPVYNGGKFIEQSIQSVLTQKYIEFQLIIIDDFSNDNSVEIIKNYLRDERVEFYINQENMGAAYSRNFGLSRSRHKLIAFLDCDDYWGSNKLTTQVAFMRETKCGISYGNYQIVDEFGTSKKNVNIMPKEICYTGYLKNTIIGTSTSMINLDIVGSISFENFRTRQDLVLWLKLLKNGNKAKLFPGNHVYYRVHKNSLSSYKIKAMYTVFQIYLNHEKLPFLKSCYYFMFYFFNAVKKKYF